MWTWILAVVCLAIIIAVLRALTPRHVAPSQPVQAVWTAAASKQNVPRAHLIEQAMSQAVMECLGRGVSIEDKTTIQAAMQAARARIIQQNP